MGDEGRGGHEGGEQDRTARPQPHEQPDRLRGDEEHPEVVRGERERADHGTTPRASDGRHGGRARR